MIKAIYFDYHGVLDHHSFGGLIQMIQERSGKAVTPQMLGWADAYLRDVMSAEEFWLKIEGLGYTKDLIKEAQRYILTTEPNTQLLEAIADLKKHYHIGVLSDMPKEKAILIQQEKILHDVDETIYSYDRHLSKSTDEFFLLMTHNKQYQPDSCLFVDDEQRHVNRALSLGFRSHCYRDVPTLLVAIRELDHSP